MPRPSRSREFSGTGKWPLLSNACQGLPPGSKSWQTLPGNDAQYETAGLDPPYPPKPGILAHSICFLTQDPVRNAFTERNELAKRGKLVDNWQTQQRDNEDFCEP